MRKISPFFLSFDCSQCLNAIWRCTQSLCKDTCSIVNSLIVTFDGRTYSLNGRSCFLYAVLPLPSTFNDPSRIRVVIGRMVDRTVMYHNADYLQLPMVVAIFYQNLEVSFEGNVQTVAVRVFLKTSDSSGRQEITEK